MAKLATQQEVKNPANDPKIMDELTRPVEDGGMGLSVAAAKELVKDGGVYETATVWATKDAPYHKEGEEVFCSKALADKMIKQGWATDKKLVAKKAD